MGARKKRVEVPAHDYEPTKDEMEELVTVETDGQSFEESVEQFLRTPVEVTEVSSKEWRRRRKEG